MPNRLALLIDTGLDQCRVALAQGDEIVADRCDPISRGHAEALAPLVDAVVETAGCTPKDLDRIIASVGPGSFTGVRVGVAYARGLALALDIPAVGISTLVAMGCVVAGAVHPGAVVVALDARRGQIYAQAFENGQPADEPQAISAADFAASTPAPDLIVGSGAALLHNHWPDADIKPLDGPTALGLLTAAALAPRALSPLYLRAPGATPPKPSPLNPALWSPPHDRA